MINNYNDFREERQIDILLEAKIEFDKDFLKLLNDFESPIAKKVISLKSTDVDVNTNYIAYDVDKNDKVLFKPDDKVEKSKFVIDYKNNSMSNALHAFSNLYKKELGFTNCMYPGNNTLIDIEEVDKALLDKLADNFKSNWLHSDLIYALEREVVSVKWKVGDIVYHSLINKSDLKRDSNSIKNSEIAVGRFTRALLKKANQEFTDKDIEEFVTEFKTAMRIKKDSFDNFQIVQGDDIKKYYLEGSYENLNGTLGSSCMRHKKCQSYLNIYSKNTNRVNMIILRSITDSSKICGRALLWTDENGRRLMDRIYINDSSNESLFIEYAISNGFLYKKKQDYNEELMFNRTRLDPKSEEGIFFIILDNFYDEFPYMDTMKYYSESDDSLSSDPYSTFDYELSDTNGGNGSCSECGGSGRISCEDCGGDGEYECYGCDGRSKVDCNECNGSGHEDCSDCNGSGHENCDECNGSGEIEDDEGNEVECSNCDEGKVECSKRNCDEGRVECSTCEGDSYVECGDCEGEGVINCGECGGDGSVRCYECG